MPIITVITELHGSIDACLMEMSIIGIVFHPLDLIFSMWQMHACAIEHIQEKLTDLVR